MNVYISDRIVERINIPANYVNKNLDSRILDFIKNKIGDKCVETGYINSKDITVIGRTNGLMDVSHFTGNIVFDVECKVNIFNPPEGAILYCKVVNKNKMGLVLETAQIKPSPIRILLAREHHIGNDLFDSSVINDRVYVEVIAKRHEYNDTQIQAIGILSTKEALLKQNPEFIAKKTLDEVVPKDKPIDICHAPVSPSYVPKSQLETSPTFYPTIQDDSKSSPQQHAPTSPIFDLTYGYKSSTPPYAPISPSFDPTIHYYSKPSTPAVAPPAVVPITLPAIPTTPATKTPSTKKKRRRKKKLVIVEDFHQ